MLDVGDVLDGRYQLLRDLGRGAAGVVYEARHLFTGRFVAVKMLLPQARRKDHAELRTRLEREGRALASIRHPGVVEVLDGGLTVEGYSYLALEMLEGRTLEGMIAARNKLPVNDAVGLALQLCDALGAVHGAGVVHRDVKPSNIIVVRGTPGFEVVKLLDFGVAKLLDSVSEDKLTRAGAVVGTPDYMPPEQLLGEGDIDARSDVYSLGVTLYECLSGATPHQGNYSRILISAAGGPPVTPLSAAAPDVPKALGAVVDQAIARAPAARFGTMRDMAIAIEHAIPGATRTTKLRSPPPLPGQQAGTVEHRRAARAPYNTPVRLVVQGGTVDGRTEDISEGGLLILTPAVCAAGQSVSARFALPMDGKVASVEAAVRWVRGARGVDRQGINAIGLEFCDAPAPVRDSIARYVKLMSSQPGS
ncbi:MAG TPA: serine/threonine-protein kinase [Polyangiaceae bacterium]|jgi:serine/threonine-protein kinase